MLIAECKGWHYLHWAVGFGLGPAHIRITDCQLYTTRKPSQKIGAPKNKD